MEPLIRVIINFEHIIHISTNCMKPSFQIIHQVNCWRLEEKDILLQ